jgi:N-acetylglucosaminyl-diphospho-decaprenol L-rhamnosyltransferase
VTELAFVVVSWNSSDELPALLDSIGRYLADAQLVVVDNGSTDGSAELVQESRGDAKLIRLDENRGFGAAANVGVAAASGQVIVLLNPDVRLVDGSLRDLATVAWTTRSLCGPELLNEDLSRQPSASAVPAGWEGALDALLPASLMPRLLRERCEPWRAQSTREVGWVVGACLAARREVLLELGPFDERLHLYAEDMDLALRARGIASIYCPDVARVIHIGERATRRRFGDERIARKLLTRRLVVRTHRGAARERYDYAAQFGFHTTRYLAKRALSRDARPERSWLAAALRPEQRPADGRNLRP